MKNRIIIKFSLLILLFLVSAANAALVDNGNGTVTQYRNDGSILMWLKDANYAMTSGYDQDGQMPWGTANSWAEYLGFCRV